SSYEIIRRDNPTARALILGVSHEDVAMASGLVSQKTSDFRIVGFLDTKNKTKKNNIFGLSVYKLQDLSHIRKPAEAIIVDEVKLKQLRDQEPDILNQLLDQEFKIYKLPRLQDCESSGSDFERLDEINIEDLLQRSPIKLNNNKLFSVYENKTVLI